MILLNQLLKRIDSVHLLQGIWTPFYTAGPSAPLEGPSDRAHLLPLPDDVVRLMSTSTSTNPNASASGRSTLRTSSASAELESDGSWITWDATRSTLTDRVRQLMLEEKASTSASASTSTASAHSQRQSAGTASTSASVGKPTASANTNISSQKP